MPQLDIQPDHLQGRTGEGGRLLYGMHGLASQTTEIHHTWEVYSFALKAINYAISEMLDFILQMAVGILINFSSESKIVLHFKSILLHMQPTNTKYI